MRQALAAIALVAITAPALAQMTPVGLWRSFDEKTNEPKSEVRIGDNGETGAPVGVSRKRQTAP